MLRLKKSLGQNFLSDNNVIEKITSLDDLKGQTVIEIGPGSGNLTEFIIKKKKIWLFRKRSNFCKLLKEKFGNQKNIRNT